MWNKVLDCNSQHVFDEKLNIRPHHFLCLLGFAGKGYSKDFIRNMQRIVSIIHARPEYQLKIASEIDSICMHCPNRVKDRCIAEEKVNELDCLHSDALGFTHLQMTSWREAKQAILANVSLAVFHKICAKCEWRHLGMCESSLRALIDKGNA